MKFYDTLLLLENPWLNSLRVILYKKLMTQLYRKQEIQLLISISLPPYLPTYQTENDYINKPIDIYRRLIYGIEIALKIICKLNQHEHINEM